MGGSGVQRRASPVASGPRERGWHRRAAAFTCR
jgi:hypothetical protein